MLNPTGIGMIAAALSASVIVGPAAWIGRGLVFEHFERPAIERALNDAATIRIMDAARQATQAERTRQQAASASALRIYKEAIDATKRAAQAREAQIEQENRAYVALLLAEGRSSVWTDLDLDERRQWLLDHFGWQAD